MLGQLAEAVSKEYQDKANCGKMFSFISKILPGFNGCCVFEPVAHHSYFIDLTPPDSPLFLKMKKKIKKLGITIAVMTTSYLLLMIFLSNKISIKTSTQIESKHCNNYVRNVWTAKSIILKNTHHLVTLYESVMVS